jgi:hypothetical protein
MAGVLFLVLNCVLGVTIVVQNVVHCLLSVVESHGEPSLITLCSVLGFLWVVYTIVNHITGVLHGYHHWALW